jgi:hypothetical protein
MLRQPSVPVLRGGGGGGVSGGDGIKEVGNGGRKRAASVSSGKVVGGGGGGGGGASGSGFVHGLGLAPALPIFGRKGKETAALRIKGTGVGVGVVTAGGLKISAPRPSLDGHVQKDTRSHNQHGHAGQGTERIVLDSPGRAPSPSNTPASAGAASQTQARSSPDDTPASASASSPPSPTPSPPPTHIRARLQTLAQLARVLGFEHVEIARKIDVPALLERVDRACESYARMAGDADGDEDADGDGDGDLALASSPRREAQTKVEDTRVPPSPTLSSMSMASAPAPTLASSKSGAEQHNQDTKSASPTHASGTGSDMTLGGMVVAAELDLLPADTPLDVFPTSASERAIAALNARLRAGISIEDDFSAADPLGGGGSDNSTGEGEGQPDAAWLASTYGASLVEWGFVDDTVKYAPRDEGGKVDGEGPKGAEGVAGMGCEKVDKEHSKQKEKGGGVFGRFRGKGRKSFKEPRALAMDDAVKGDAKIDGKAAAVRSLGSWDGEQPGPSTARRGVSNSEAAS